MKLFDKTDDKFKNLWYNKYKKNVDRSKMKPGNIK